VYLPLSSWVYLFIYLFTFLHRSAHPLDFTWSPSYADQLIPSIIATSNDTLLNSHACFLRKQHGSYQEQTASTSRQRSVAYARAILFSDRPYHRDRLSYACAASNSIRIKSRRDHIQSGSTGLGVLCFQVSRRAYLCKVRRVYPWPRALLKAYSTGNIITQPSELYGSGQYLLKSMIVTKYG
jgi:hypothetical protein